MSLRPYNGYTPVERLKAGRVQAAAVLSSQIQAAECRVCAVCAEKPAVVLHVEDYSQPLLAIEHMCYQCHWWWHRRHTAGESALEYFRRQPAQPWRHDPRWYGPEGLSPGLEDRGPLNRPTVTPA